MNFLAVVGIGLGAGRSPAFRSLVAASVEPLRQGTTSLIPLSCQSTESKSVQVKPWLL